MRPRAEGASWLGQRWPHGWLAWVITLLSVLLLGGQARADPAEEPSEPPRISILTYNAFLAPTIAESIDERRNRLPDAVAELGPDIVALQEVWADADADALRLRFAELGYPFAHYVTRDANPIPLGSAGLMTVSRFPLRAVAFQPFVAGRFPTTPWHVDYMANKGVLVTRVETSHGVIDVANTHLQSSYRTGHYEATRVAQIAEIQDFFESKWSPSPGAVHLLAGDVNGLPDGPTYQAIELFLDAAPASRFGLDAVFIGRRNQGWSVVSAAEVLSEPIRSTSGEPMMLSDHRGVLVTFHKRVVDEVESSASASRVADTLCQDRGRLDVVQIGAGAIGLVAIGLAFRVRRRVARRRRRVLFALAWFVTLLSCIYFAFVFVPSHRDRLDWTLTKTGLDDACR